MGSGGGHAALHSTSQAGAGPHTAPQSFLPFLTLEALPAALLAALLGPAVAAGEGAGAAAAGAAAAALGCFPIGSEHDEGNVQACHCDCARDGQGWDGDCPLPAQGEQELQDAVLGNL